MVNGIYFKWLNAGPLTGLRSVLQIGLIILQGVLLIINLLHKAWANGQGGGQCRRELTM